MAPTAVSLYGRPAQPPYVPAGIAARKFINHVFIIVQENRTLDNIFGGRKSNPHNELAGPLAFPGAEAVWPDDIAPLMKSQRFGGPPSIDAGHDVWQCLKYGGFSSDTWKALPTGATCKDYDRTIKTDPFNYLAVDLRETYWDIARKYVLGDHFFAITSTSSFPPHQYIISGQARTDERDPIADQPREPKGENQGDRGCLDYRTNVSVPTLGPDGYIKWIQRVGGECYGHTTLADLMDKKQVPWAHYGTVQWIANPNGPGGKLVPSTVFDGFINSRRWSGFTISTWPTSCLDLEKDIGNGSVSDKKVVWVKPACVHVSDHPNGASTDDSAGWVGSVVNWIGQSSLWNDTVIFVLWDDWGGFYDHVVPPETRSDKLGPGLRTPFLVISAYGQNGKVIKAQADYGSILKFIEDRFELGRLSEVDQTANDLYPFFDFYAKPAKFTKVTVEHPFNKSICESPGVDPEEIDR
jgi:phospholipase C